jgi:hypothetical protein
MLAAAPLYVPHQRIPSSRGDNGTSGVEFGSGVNARDLQIGLCIPV